MKTIALYSDTFVMRSSLLLAQPGVDNPDMLQRFRSVFGNESIDYTAALKNYL